MNEMKVYGAGLLGSVAELRVSRFKNNRYILSPDFLKLNEVRKLNFKEGLTQILNFVIAIYKTDLFSEF